MTRSYAFSQVDVFSSEPYRGNPVAVFFDAESISDEDMACIARWTNLSETTFVLPPTSDDADYRLRIFTQTGEIPFAGHPTLGSARAWLDNRGTPRTPGAIVQECRSALRACSSCVMRKTYGLSPRLRRRARGRSKTTT